MPLKLPKIIGHRGCAAYAPENTLEGIHMAADMGVEWVEFDVKLTKDEVPILFHDSTLDRTTSGTGNVADRTYKEIMELDCGSWFGESFIGIQIPTLEQAIDVLIERGLGLNLEIKPCPGREKETAEIALDLLSTIWDDHDRLLISSLQPVSLEVACDMAADWHRGLLLPEEWPENWAELVDYLQVSTVNVNANNVTRDQIESIIDKEKQILAYTVNNPDQARLLQSWGVDGFFSDCPDVLEEGIFSVH
ncbi:MAG: glycerophosphoryl diester phosphodiesterase [Alphaproteobacteria bacterium]|nr:glycerophosphoryl diester phosphodiesterase [Alphaproteobacteria bacterium]